MSWGRIFAFGLVGATAMQLALAPPCSAACGPQEASALYQQARKAFDEKKFDESIALLQKANACDPNPVYFANIARAFEEANRPREALAAWRAYQEVVTDAKERSRAQGRIAVLTQTVEQLDAQEKEAKRKRDEAAEKKKEPSQKPPENLGDPSSPPPPPPPARSLSVPALVVTGVGLVGIGVGAVLGISASSKHDDAVAERDVKTADSIQNDAVDLGHAANIAIIAGSVVAAGGIAWLGIDWFSSPPSPKNAAAATAAGSTKLVMTGRGIALAGTF